MIIEQNVIDFNSRLNAVVVAQLANAVIAAGVAVRSCDPFQVWESHPAISKFLHLKDREIAAAIDLANSI